MVKDPSKNSLLRPVLGSNSPRIQSSSNRVRSNGEACPSDQSIPGLMQKPKWCFSKHSFLQVFGNLLGVEVQTGQVSFSSKQLLVSIVCSGRCLELLIITFWVILINFNKYPTNRLELRYNVDGLLQCLDQLILQCLSCPY